MTRAFRRRSLVAALLAVLLLPAAAGAQDAPAPVRVPAVTVATAQVRELKRRVPVSGTLVPREEVMVYPEINGYRITALNVEVGDRVEAGDVLAEVDQRTLRARVAEADAALASARAAVQQNEGAVASAEATLFRSTRALERTRTLRERGTVAESAFEEAEELVKTAQATLTQAQSGVAGAEAQRQQAEASLEVAQLDLANGRIEAPVGGVVSDRTGRLGAIAGSGGDPIYRIIRDGEVEVEADVVETDLGRIEVGDAAEIDVAGVGTVAGHVRLIAPEVARASRLGTVFISLAPHAGLRPGLFAGGWITAEEREGLAVPATAVISDAEGDHVLVVRDGVLHRRPVVGGIIWQDYREVLRGLIAGDEVVARAGAFFGEGDRIRPVRAGDTGIGAARPPRPGAPGEIGVATGTAP